MSDLHRLLDQATRFHASGQLAEAETLYARILSADSANFNALHFLGLLRAQQGRNMEALSLIGTAIQINPRLAAALTNHGNVLMALGRPGEAVASYDKSLALKPDAETLTNKAVALQAVGRLESAIAAYEAVLVANPRQLQAWNNRGQALQELQRYREALESYDRALSIKPDDAKIWINRSITLWSMNQFALALDSADRALGVDPHSAPAWSHRGNVLRALDRPDAAMESFDRAIALDANDADAHLNKSYCLLLAGRWREGWALFEWRKRLAVPVEARSFSQPLWTGKEDVRGKTLFCYVGQGLGDTIQFFRYCALVKARGGRVVLALQNSLARLLKTADPEIEVIDQNSVPAQFDYHIPLMSLPLAFDTTVETIPDPGPYLVAETERVQQWRAAIGTQGFKIGIAWRGNERGIIRGRSFPPALLERLAKLPGVRLISLQKDATDAELQTIHAERPSRDFDNGPDAFIDTAAVMQSLDLVITADTSIAHIGGALGRPTWIALKHLPDWRWLLGRADTPWYASVTLFRQPSEGDWAGALAQMEQALMKLI